MTIVPAIEAPAKFGELLDLVAGGEEITITRQDQPIARMIPEGTRDLTSVRQAVAGLPTLQAKIAVENAGMQSISWEEFKTFVEVGRWHYDAPASADWCHHQLWADSGHCE